MPFDDARKAASARLAQLGAPQKSHEYWRYTDPALLDGAGTAAQNAPALAGIDAYRLVFTDGFFDAAASDTVPSHIIDFSTLDAPAPWAAPRYGALESLAQATIARPLAAQNTASATSGVMLRVTGQLDRPVSLIYKSKSDDYAAILHHCIHVEAGGAITLLESGDLPSGANTMMEITLADGAQLHHIRAQAPDTARRLITHIFAHLGSNAQLKSFTLTAQGALTRNEAAVWLAGNDAVAHLAGAALGSGAQASCHQDDTIYVTHGALRGQSRQVFKKVLSSGATGVFQGKILVKPGAQKTDGYQISQALLLDDDAQFLAKPELEIYADDVKCSHGSTTGAIDETALFYLRSRGVPRDQATLLLVLSFLADAVAEIEDEALREHIGALVQDWLARGQA